MEFRRYIITLQSILIQFCSHFLLRHEVVPPSSWNANYTRRFTGYLKELASMISDDDLRVIDLAYPLHLQCVHNRFCGHNQNQNCLCPYGDQVDQYENKILKLSRSERSCIYKDVETSLGRFSGLRNFIILTIRAYPVWSAHPFCSWIIHFISIIFFFLSSWNAFWILVSWRPDIVSSSYFQYWCFVLALR